jgi:hypothetical protein
MVEERNKEAITKQRSLALFEVKNAWSYTSSVAYVFLASLLTKHGDNFALYFAIMTCLKLLSGLWIRWPEENH